MESTKIKKKKGRKLRFEDQPYEEKKRRSNHNEPFRYANGEWKTAKEFTPINDCCTKECWKIVGQEAQQQQFTKFYGLGSYEARSLYINQNVTIKTILKRSKELSDKRVFHLNGQNVCRKFFLNVLQINQSRVDLVLEKLEAYTLRDCRGLKKGKNSREKLPPKLQKKQTKKPKKKSEKNQEPSSSTQAYNSMQQY